MTGSREPIPQDYGNFDIDLKKAVLAEALGAFSTKILADDMLFRAISTTLRDGEPVNEAETDLRTDFIVTPNVKDGEYSLCLEESAKGYAGEVEADSGAVGDMFFKIATMKYVSVCVLETDESGKHRIVYDTPFVELALGRDVATQKPTQDEIAAVETAVRTVLGGVNEILQYCEQRGVEVVPDEHGRPQLLEETHIKNYFTE